MTRARSLVTVVLLAVPLIIAALWAGLGNLDPARTWADDGSGAPTTGSSITAADLVDARRAGSEANAQAGFLETGATELHDGTEDLKDGTEMLHDGAEAVATGAQDLSDGMVEIQAGVGALGTGATQVADAVGGAVDSVVGINALKGQVVEAMNHSIDDLEGNSEPAAIAARDELTRLRDELNLIEITADDITQLTELKDGSREIANQLTVPGYAFHDGIFEATTGAADLHAGVVDLRDGIQAADDGVDDLKEGAERVEYMAAQNNTKVTEFNRALPALPPVEDGEEPAGQAVSPVVAMLIAALVMLAGIAAGAAAMHFKDRHWWILGGVTASATVAGLVLLMVLGVGISPTAIWLSALGLALGTLAAAGVTAVLIAMAGTTIGLSITAVLAIFQLGIVGWVWRTAATGPVSEGAHIVASLLPLHWNTAALTAAGNNGDPEQLWLGMAVMGALAIIGLVALATRRAPSVDKSAEE